MIKQQQQCVESSPLSMKFHTEHNIRKTATNQMSDDITLKDMCQMMMIHMAFGEWK